MKNIIKNLLLLFILIFSIHVSAEEINKYTVDIYLNKDASISVTETIDYDFGELDKHGIYRFIPLTFEVDGQKKWHGLKQRFLRIEGVSVIMDGEYEEFSINEKDENGNFFIKIGKSDETITGPHTYVIKYNVFGSLRYFNKYDELYWNAIGLDWKVPIREAKISMRSDNVSFENFSCYAGRLGEKKKCSQENKEAKKISFSFLNLAPHEGVTIASSFKKDSLPHVEYFSFTTKAFVLGGVSFLLIFFVGLWYLIRKYKRKYFVYDPIHPRYTPPEDFDAIFTGYLVDKKLDPRDISAGIIQLARDGYITFEKIENKSFLSRSVDYKFVLIKTIDEVNSEINQIRKFLLLFLFKSEASLVDYMSKMKKVSDKFGMTDNKKVKVFGSEYANTVMDYMDSIPTDSLREEILLSEISHLKRVSDRERINKYIKRSAIDGDYFEEKNQKSNWLFFIPFIIIFVAFLTKNIIFGFIMFFIIFVSIAVSASIQIRYTKKGWKVKHAIEGFKLFLEMTEKERYEFFNDPADNPQEFMEYLPYAIALGVEKKWAKQFASITIPQPEWYKGSGPFVVTAFADEMSSFSEKVTSSVATMSSSGFGSGGGGFSGGGSGGGGGGSW